jgi:hypothetical protein
VGIPLAFAAPKMVDMILSKMPMVDSCHWIWRMARPPMPAPNDREPIKDVAV